MNEEKERILEKIKKALLLAEDREGTPEGENAKSHACRLMAKYRIDETEIDMETDNFVFDQFHFEYDNNKPCVWVKDIVWMFCETFGTSYVYRELWYQDETEFDIIGTFSDVETVKYFVEVVTRHIEVACWKTWPKKRNRMKREQLGKIAAERIWDRLYEIKNEMDKTIHEDENCSALVVQKENEIAEAVKAAYPKLRRSKRPKIKNAQDSKTINAGLTAGDSCPLSFAIE